MSEEIETMKKDLAACQREREALRKDLETVRARELHLIDACRLFAERCGAKPEEVAQLGIATLIPGEEGKPATVQWNTLDDLVDATNFAMKQQATVAKFRQLKAHFIEHQRAVAVILDELGRMGRKNVLTTTDMRRVSELRAVLESMIRRGL